MLGAAGIISGPVRAGISHTSLDFFTATCGRALRMGAPTAPTLLENDPAGDELKQELAE
jgi:hypothetical protein